MKASTLWICGVTVLALAAGLWAEGENPRLLQAWGKVVGVDIEAKTLVLAGKTKRDEEPRELTFAVTDGTKIILPAGEGSPSRAGTLADVKPDARVTVLYRAAPDGTLTALSLTLLAAATK